jgi:hypothetical protein
MDAKAGRGGGDDREFGEDPNGGRIEPDLLFGLAQRGVGVRNVLRFAPSARKRDLPAVNAALGAQDEDHPQRPRSVPVDRREDRRVEQLRGSVHASNVHA